ncbi:MAG: hypothetical protein DMF68_17975 [Acidobacteria bacterium]|nr:MAG: hypothetical protein DMF68_17975 [Acidobacteriota bacterium]
MFAQIIVAEEDIASASFSNERRLFAKVLNVRANNRKPPGIAPGKLIFYPVVAAIERANGTAK